MGKKLKDVKVEEISLVDNPAIGEHFYMTKNCILIKSVEGAKVKAIGGLWVQCQITDDETWDKVEKEFISAFSWSGQPSLEVVESIEGYGRKGTIKEIGKLIDISVVTCPADPEAGFKVTDKANRIIEGLVSTDVENFYYEVIEPTAFAKVMPGYMEKPPKGTIFYNHNFDIPVGKILKWEVRSSNAVTEETKDQSQEEKLTTEGGETKMVDEKKVEKNEEVKVEVKVEEVKPEEKKVEEPKVEEKKVEKQDAPPPAEDPNSALAKTLQDVVNKLSSIVADISALVASNKSATPAEKECAPKEEEVVAGIQKKFDEALAPILKEIELIKANTHIRKGLTEARQREESKTEDNPIQKIADDKSKSPRDRLKGIFENIPVGE